MKKTLPMTGYAYVTWTTAARKSQTQVREGYCEYVPAVYFFDFEHLEAQGDPPISRVLPAVRVWARAADSNVKTWYARSWRHGWVFTPYRYFGPAPNGIGEAVIFRDLHDPAAPVVGLNVRAAYGLCERPEALMGACPCRNSWEHRSSCDAAIDRALSYSDAPDLGTEALAGPRGGYAGRLRRWHINAPALCEGFAYYSWRRFTSDPSIKMAYTAIEDVNPGEVENAREDRANTLARRKRAQAVRENECSRCLFGIRRYNGTVLSCAKPHPTSQCEGARTDKEKVILSIQRYLREYTQTLRAGNANGVFPDRTVEFLMQAPEEPLTVSIPTFSSRPTRAVLGYFTARTYRSDLRFHVRCAIAGKHDREVEYPSWDTLCEDIPEVRDQYTAWLAGNPPPLPEIAYTWYATYLSNSGEKSYEVYGHWVTKMRYQVRSYATHHFVKYANASYTRHDLRRLDLNTPIETLVAAAGLEPHADSLTHVAEEEEEETAADA